MSRVLLIPTLVSLLACKPPPPAPEGLDDAATYLLREFYASDEKFQAGVQGFVNWYFDDGIDLIDLEITLDETSSFSLSDLEPEDIAMYPVSPEIVVDPLKDEGDPERMEVRDVTNAKGVVSLALMECDWKRTETYLVRPDQNVIFSDDFEDYERTYLTNREVYEQASVAEEFDEIAEDLAPFDGQFDAEVYQRSLLLTANDVDPSAVLLANLDTYPMNLDMRHGVYSIEQQDHTDEVGVVAVVTYQIDAAWGSAGVNALLQSYSIEINVEQPGDTTLRLLAVWAEPTGSGIEADSPIALNFAVNKATASSERLSAICAGDIEVPDEG